MRLIVLAALLCGIGLGAAAQGVAPPASGSNASNSTVTATSATQARTLAAITADTYNVLSFAGADPSGNESADNSVPINAALAATRNGTIGNVYLPAGTYHVKNQINLGSATQSQCLFGDGWNTVIDVDSDFNTTASGVVVVTTGGTTLVKPCVKGVRFVFHQPPDVVTTTTGATLAGNNTITLNSTAGLVNGMTVIDTTATGAILSPVYGTSATPTTMTFSGSTATLSANVASPGVGTLDTIHFASPRSAFTTLAAGCTTTTGGTGCQYPWAIYNNGAPNLLLDNVNFSGAWEGVYQRGSAFQFGLLTGEAFSVGLDIDNCHNFPTIDDYMFYNFTTTNAAYMALGNVFYDGTTVAANIGATDGITINQLQDWTGIVNVTANFTWGHITSLEMDGSNAILNVLSTDASGFLKIGNMYSTLSTNSSAGALTVNANAAFPTTIGSYYLGSSYAAGPSVTLTQGILDIGGGNLIRSGGGTQPLVSEAAGSLKINAVHFTGNGNATNGQYVSQAGGALEMQGNSVDTAFTTGWTAITVTDSAKNNVSNNILNGWGLTGTGTLGAYNLNGPAGAVNTTGALNAGTLSTTTSTIKGTLDLSLATTDIVAISTSLATISNPLEVLAPNLNTATNTSIHLGVADSSDQDFVLAFNYVGSANSGNNFSIQAFGGTKAFTATAAGAVTVAGGSTQDLTFGSSFYDSCTALTTTAAGLVGCTTSDARVKNDDGTISPWEGLRRILADPDPHDFTYKDGYGPGGHHEGMFAQEMRKVHPDLVSVGPPTDLTPDGELRFDQTAQVADLVQSVKALQWQINRLQREVRSYHRHKVRHSDRS
jgi:hypothetical protein